MLESGTRSKELLRRLAVYKELVSSALAHHEEFVRRYAERVRQASVTRDSEVDGEELRVLSGRYIITGRLVCQLCESDFLTEEDFVRHKLEHHAGETEYRKRVLYVMAEAELQALQQAEWKRCGECLQMQPRDARAQGGDAGTVIRRRPAARNAKEVRRLSRRADAS